jgi:hypothetical protein
VSFPDLAVVRAYLKIPATSLSDEDLQRMMDASQADQLARCTWPGAEPDPVPDDPASYPPALEQAFLRRVQREAAARNLPLGMVGTDAAEYGPTRLPELDALVESHERAYRRQVIA